MWLQCCCQAGVLPDAATRDFASGSWVSVALGNAGALLIGSISQDLRTKDNNSKVEQRVCSAFDENLSASACERHSSRWGVLYDRIRRCAKVRYGL
jgi:hypothetical protein